MDHAGDVARKIRRGYLGHPWNRGDAVHASTEGSDRDRHVFTITTSDGGAFRITVEDVGYDGLSDEEIHLDDVSLDEDDPLYVAPEPPADSPATHRLLPDGRLEPL